MEKGEECTSTRRPLFFVENSNYMDTPTPGDDEVVIDNHGVVLGNDDDDVVVLEPTPGNDNDGISKPTSGNDVDGVSEPTPGNDDDGVSCPTLGNDDGDGGVSEPTPGMFFKTEKELIYYYKQYGRQAGFGIMTQRSKREDDGSVRYVTLGCARGGKAKKRITNISKPRPTTKTDCKARINAVWAGMSTTQRSESMNAFFDGYVHSGTTLKEFVDQFDNALRKKVENEIAADFHSFNATVPCISHLPLEKKFQAVYTNSKFKEVQSEVMGIIYSHCVIIKTEGAITTYLVNDSREVEDGIKKSTVQAYFNEEECEAKCMCGLFEMRGIICRHMLSIFAARDVQVLPEKYIMERWRKDIKRRYVLIRSSYDDLSGKPAAIRYFGLIKICYEVATNACESEENSLDMTEKLTAMNSIYSKTKSQATVASTHISADAETGSSRKVLSPRVVRGKGRPPSKRKQPTMEKLQAKNRAFGKRQRKNATSLMKDVLNAADSVNQIGTPQSVPAQLPGTQQSVISQENFEMHGPHVD